MPETLLDKPVRVALIGAGTIAGPYVAGLRATPGFEVTAVATRDPATAAAFAATHDLNACDLASLLADPGIDYVLNLTPASAHEAVTRACLEAGKSVYSEKPLAASLAGADALIALADARGLLLACAPATFLWPPLATMRRLVEEGRLGPVIGALSTLVYPGPELFHPNPAHLYARDAGPLRDMGVYQVTALTALLGSVVAVTAMASRAQDERTVLVGPAAGRGFPVERPTHLHAQLRHAGGAISSLIVSFDGSSASEPRLDLYGRDAGLTMLNPHAPGATLSLLEGAQRSDLTLDGPVWSPASFALGPSSAWLAHIREAPVPASATRARDVLAVLLAVEMAVETGTVVAPVSSGT